MYKTFVRPIANPAAHLTPYDENMKQRKVCYAISRKEINTALCMKKDIGPPSNFLLQGYGVLPQAWASCEGDQNQDVCRQICDYYWQLLFNTIVGEGYKDIFARGL